MNGDFLLDTNIIIALFYEEQDVIKNIENSNTIYIPSIVIGELYYGAYNSNKIQENLKQLNEFQNDANILNCDKITAGYYGQIKKGLKDKGNPIPENDIWIAALTIQYDLELISRDKHFSKIDRLKTNKW